MYKYLLHIIIVLGLSGIGWAQEPASKSSSEWLSLIQKSRPDTNRISLLCKLGNWYFTKLNSLPIIENKYLDSSIIVFTQALHLSDSLQTRYQWDYVRRLLGRALFLKGKIPEGEKIFMEVINEFQKNSNKESEAATWLLMFEAREINMVEVRERNFNSYPDILKYLGRAKELYRSLGKAERQARVQLQIADLDMKVGKLVQAEIGALQALDEYREIGHPKLYDTYYMLSVINRYQGDLDQSLFYAIRCVENMDSSRDQTTQPALFYGELALVYDGLENPEESAKWYRMVLAERESDKQANIFIFRTAGLLIQQLVKMKKGAEALLLMEEIEKKFPPAGHLENAAIAQNFGHCYQAVGQFRRAERYFLEMIREYEATNFQDEFTSKAFEDIGNFYLLTEEYQKAVDYLSKALSSPSLHLISRQRDVHFSLYKADSAMGNYLAAINDFRNYKMLTDSLFNERKSRQIEELQIKYQTEKKEKDIIVLNALNRVQENKLQRSALIRNLIIAGILILSGLLYYRFRLKSISNKKLEAQQRLINQKNLSLTQLVTEKEWLVKEIHHRVKNNFHMVMGLLATQSKFLKSPEAISAMRESRQRIHAMSLIHQKLYQSDNLSTISMPGYVHELVNYLRESFDIRGSIHFDFDIDPVELDLSHAIPLGLILNEAITNAIKYAFPGGREGIIEISVKQKQEHHWVVIVRDNGIGLPATHEAVQNSMGIKLMKGLSEDIDANLTIGGDQGTTIRIEFYYEPEKNGIS